MPSFLIGTTSYVYDSANQLTNQKDKNGSGTVLNNYTYTYDSDGNVKTQVLGGTTTTYSYNAANELTNDTANSYSYDLAGNRNMTGYQTGTGNELKNDGSWTYTYDSEGNMTEKSQGANATTWFYTFDNNNQMTTAQQFSKASGGTLQASVTYVYDALQNRIEVDSWTQSSGTTTVTRFGYDGNQVWVDVNSSNQLQVRYLHGDVIDQLFARINSSGTAAWYLTDRLESIRGMVDNTGALQETVAYDGYGNITIDSNTTFGDRYKFTGREMDSVTGLQYNRARYYSGPVGRWVSQDPLGFKGGDVDLYRFVGNEPVALTDPTGLSWKSLWIWDFWNWLRGDSGGASSPTPQPSPPESNAGRLASKFGTVNWAEGDTASAVPKVGPITFGHGARHLVGTGLTEEEVDGAILEKIKSLPGDPGNHYGWVNVGGKWIQYRYAILEDGSAKVGSYFPVSGPLRKK